MGDFKYGEYMITHGVYGEYLALPGVDLLFDAGDAFLAATGDVRLLLLAVCLHGEEVGRVGVSGEG